MFPPETAEPDHFSACFRQCSVGCNIFMTPEETNGNFLEINFLHVSVAELYSYDSYRKWALESFIKDKDTPFCSLLK